MNEMGKGVLEGGGDRYRGGERGLMEEMREMAAVAWVMTVVTWLVLTVRHDQGRRRLTRIASWPGHQTLAILDALVPARHRRRIAVYVRAAWTTYRCWRHGIR